MNYFVVALMLFKTDSRSIQSLKLIYLTPSLINLNGQLAQLQIHGIKFVNAVSYYGQTIKATFLFINLLCMLIKPIQKLAKLPPLIRVKTLQNTLLIFIGNRHDFVVHRLP